MRRAIFIVSALVLATATAAWSALSILPVNDLTRPVPGASHEVIEIAVPAQDLGRCIAALMQVTQMPVAAGDVTGIHPVDPSEPMVRCVVE